MKIYQVPPPIAVIVVSALCTGMLCVFVFLPVLCIQWAWNSVFTSFPVLPQISAWQAGLLYVAGAITLYLTGIVRIDFETSHLDG